MTPKSHTDREYESQLQELRERLVRMTSLVEVMISEAIQALVQRDANRARRCIDTDHRVNRDEMEIDQLCLVILARRQPMASDLRFITLAHKMVTDLERIGDLAVNVCERAIDLAGLAELKPYQDIPRMAALAESMIRDAMGAFVHGDAELAREVIGRDDEVDGLYDQVFADLLEIMRREDAALEAGIHVQSVAKYLERMADHATNLAEQVIFMLQGRDVRHAGKL
jgi:phosphate transport system protein